MHMTIWHNPRCSKSRKTWALLQERGVRLTERRYLDDPPTAAEITRVLELLGVAPRELVRTGEEAYSALGLDEADDAALVAAMSEHPRLIQRPVVIAGDRAAIGRPPERALELLDDAG